MSTGVRWLLLGAVWLVAFAGCSPTPSESLTSSLSAPASATEPPSAEPTTQPQAWTFIDVPDVSVRGVAERDGRIVAVGSSYDPGSVIGGVILVSDDAVDWQSVDLSEFQLDSGGTVGISLVTAGPSGFVAAGGRSVPSEPVGIPLLLFSEDGLAWDDVTPALPGCSGPTEIIAADFGYVGFGWSCRAEGDEDPRPVHMLRSVDGRTWEVTVTDLQNADGQYPAGMATDGQRIVALGWWGPVATKAEWISDDAGITWREVELDIPAGVYPRSIAYGHDLFVVGAASVEDGVAVPQVCVSQTGESWECQRTKVSIYQHVATATGFAELHYELIESDNPREARTRTIVATSRDGVIWQEDVASQLANLTFYGAAWTTHGLLAWGGTNPTIEPRELSRPFFVLHRLALP